MRQNMKILMTFVIVGIVTCVCFGVETTNAKVSSVESVKIDDVIRKIDQLIKEKKFQEVYSVASMYEKSNNAVILCVLGDCYAFGWNGQKNFEKAFQYYNAAEEKGQGYIRALAEYRLGWFYAQGVYVAVDKEKACSLWEKAENNGFPFQYEDRVNIAKALFTPLGQYYDKEIGVRFPSKTKSFQLTGRALYTPRAQLGYSLQYRGYNDYFDLYVYNLGLTKVDDGVPAVALKDLHDAFEAVLLHEKQGVYANVKKNSAVHYQKFKKIPLQFAWTCFSYDRKDIKNAYSAIVIFCYKNRIFKIRYSGEKNEHTSIEQLPLSLQNFLSEFELSLSEGVLQSKDKSVR